MVPKIKPFTRQMYYAFAGAEGWEDKEPWYAELSNIVIPGIANPTEKWEVVLVGDSKGVGLYFGGDSGMGCNFYRSEDLEPEEAYGYMKAAIRKLKSGEIPNKYEQL